MDQALFWCTDQEAAPPSELIKEHESSIARTNGSQADREVEALSLPAAPEPNPGPQPTPESNVLVTNEPPSLDEVPALPAKAQTNRRQPKDWEQEAYELSETGKYTQGQIAEMLSRQFGCPRVQSQISRAVSRVRAWHGESKQRPNSTRNKPKNLSVDPQKLSHVVPDTGSPLSEQSPRPLSKHLNKRWDGE